MDLFDDIVDEVKIGAVMGFLRVREAAETIHDKEIGKKIVKGVWKGTKIVGKASVEVVKTVAAGENERINYQKQYEAMSDEALDELFKVRSNKSKAELIAYNNVKLKRQNMSKESKNG